MNLRSAFALILGLALGLAAAAQDASQGTPSSQNPAQESGSSEQGQRGGRGYGMGGGFGRGGRGLMGTVTETAADHYTIKTETGETYTVHFSANTRIVKQGVARNAGRVQRGEGGAGAEGGQGGGQYGGGGGGRGMGRGTPLQPSDIKVGDAIEVMGQIDADAKSVGAMAIVQIDPERARQMEQMQENYGKTWLLGRVTAIDGVKVTLMGSMDNAAHSFAADENTTFRKRREPVTLADIQVGDMVRVDGAVKDGVFVAATVNAMGMPPGGMTNTPRNGTAGVPPSSPPQ